MGKTVFSEMRTLIQKNAMYVRVQTELGTTIRVSKSEAIKFLKMLEKRGVTPSFDCTEIVPRKYLVLISSGEPGIHIS